MTSKKRPFPIELLSWDQVYNLTRRLAFSIIKSGFAPDVIVAIARGGYVPARVLCDFLNVSNLTDLRITHYAAGAKKETARLIVPLRINPKGKKVLVVDDVTDTGDTLQIVIDHIKEARPDDVKTAVLTHKKTSPVVPDFYAQKIIKWRWVIYPWAVLEDLKEFMKNMGNPPRTPELAKQRFMDEYRIKVPIKVLNDLFSLRK